MAAAAPRGAVTPPKGPRFFVAAVTPVDRGGRLDEPLARDLLAFLRERGADGVVVLGTTGEFSSFSVTERKRILEVYARAKGSLEVICQVGTPNLPETLELLGHAGGAGVDAVLVVPPFYIKNPPLEGLVRYYSPVLDTARVPVLLYHIPGTSAVPITPELLQRLGSHERLYGLKDSSGNAEGTTAFIRDFPKLKIFTGSPRHIAAMLKLGGAGAITASGNIFARETAAVFRAFREGQDPSGAQAQLDRAGDLMKGLAAVPAMKIALGQMGLRESYCRPPLVEPGPEARAELKGRIEQLAQLRQ
jgi:4-hydroxy-tetrahydrodipicolinate synthase